MNDLLLRAARGESTPRPPVWLMRQAGRYIPEYREIREEYSFREAIRNPGVAERVSLLPWKLFRPDGVVMYSDILTVLEPMGFSYEIEEGVGPVVKNPVEAPGDVPEPGGDVESELSYVGDLLERLQDRVGDRTTVIGFTGAPYTLASYVVEGDRDEVRRYRARHPDAFQELLDSFADIIVEYAAFQEERGADIIQIFDTWAGMLARRDYERYALPYHERVREAVDVPTIVFTRNPGGKLDLLARGGDVVSLDWTVDIESSRDVLGNQAVQGNLDPAYLYGSEEFVRRETRRVIRKAGKRSHILNLGHGVHRDTPVENVRAFVETAKNHEYSD